MKGSLTIPIKYSKNIIFIVIFNDKLSSLFLNRIDTFFDGINELFIHFLHVFDMHGGHDDLSGLEDEEGVEAFLIELLSAFLVV